MTSKFGAIFSYPNTQWKRKCKKITKIFHSPLHLELTLYPLQKLSKGADETIKIFQNKSSISCSFMWGSWVKMTAWRWQAILININTKYKYKICIAYTVRCVFSAIISLHKVKGRVKKNQLWKILYRVLTPPPGYGKKI